MKNFVNNSIPSITYKPYPALLYIIGGLAVNLAWDTGLSVAAYIHH